MTKKFFKALKLRHPIRALIAAAALAVSGVAWSAGVDKDGVPIVNMHGTIIPTEMPAGVTPERAKLSGIVNGRRVVTVNGVQMPIKEFLNRYCPGKHQNDTCARGTLIAQKDRLHGGANNHKLPAGL